MVVLVECNDQESTLHYFSNGQFTEGRPLPDDLINIPIKRKRNVWINIYPETDCYREVMHHSQEDANDVCGKNRRIACIEREIEFVEGEGL